MIEAFKHLSHTSWTQFLLVSSAVYLAPRVPARVSITMGIVYILLAAFNIVVSY